MGAVGLVGPHVLERRLGGPSCGDTIEAHSLAAAKGSLVAPAGLEAAAQVRELPGATSFDGAQGPVVAAAIDVAQGPEVAVGCIAPGEVLTGMDIPNPFYGMKEIEETTAAVYSPTRLCSEADGGKEDAPGAWNNVMFDDGPSPSAAPDSIVLKDGLLLSSAGPVSVVEMGLIDGPPLVGSAEAFKEPPPGRPASVGRFHFAPFWPRLDGFHETVSQAWNSVEACSCPLETLSLKLKTLTRSLQSWSQKNIGHINSQLCLAREVIHQLEIAQDSRQLSDVELWLLHSLKKHSLALSSLQRTISRIRSRINWLRDGDANTALFHSHARHGKRKNFIAKIVSEDQVLTNHEDKAGAIFDF